MDDTKQVDTFDEFLAGLKRLQERDDKIQMVGGEPAFMDLATKFFEDKGTPLNDQQILLVRESLPGFENPVDMVHQGMKDRLNQAEAKYDSLIKPSASELVRDDFHRIDCNRNRVRWGNILQRAKEILAEYPNGLKVTRLQELLGYAPRAIEGVLIKDPDVKRRKHKNKWYYYV